MLAFLLLVCYNSKSSSHLFPDHNKIRRSRQCAEHPSFQNSSSACHSSSSACHSSCPRARPHPARSWRTVQPSRRPTTIRFKPAQPSRLRGTSRLALSNGRPSRGRGSTGAFTNALPKGKPSPIARAPTRHGSVTGTCPRITSNYSDSNQKPQGPSTFYVAGLFFNCGVLEDGAYIWYD